MHYSKRIITIGRYLYIVQDATSAAIRILQLRMDFDCKGQRSAGNRTEVESTVLLFYYIIYLHTGTEHRTTINCADGPDTVENRRRVTIIIVQR